MGRLLEAGKDPALLAQLQDEMEGDLVVLSDVSSSGKDDGPVALEEYFPLSGLPIAIRIGINTGEVIAGNMGSACRLDYTVIGSKANLASRLESGARPGQVLVSKAARDALPPSILLQPAATISAKGFSDPVEVFFVEIL